MRPARSPDAGAGFAAEGLAPAAGGGAADVAGLEQREDLTARDHGAVGRDDLLQHAVDRRRHLEHDLVGLEIDEILVPSDCLAGLLVPGDERRVGDGLGQLRNFDLDAHGRLPLAALGVDSQARLPTRRQRRALAARRR